MYPPFYRPPNSSFIVLDSLHCYIESLLIFHPLFSRLEVLAFSFGLQQLITEPTHNHHNGSATTIDLVFVSTLNWWINRRVHTSMWMRIRCASDAH